jgi:hypothetical protein
MKFIVRALVTFGVLFVVYLALAWWLTGEQPCLGRCP